MAEKSETFVMQDALEEYHAKNMEKQAEELAEAKAYTDAAETTLNAAITQALTDAKAYAEGVDLEIEEEASTYVYTFTFTKADGTVYTKKIDLPIEEFVLSASYSDGKLTISLKNGESVTVDISALISGLVNQTDFDTLTDVVNGNTDDIAQLQTDVVTAQNTAEGKLDQTTADGLYASKDTENTASSALSQAGENATAIEELQTAVASKADASDLDDYEKTADLAGDVDEILAGKGYLDGDDKTELEGKITTAQNTAESADTNATQALLETAELQKTSNTGLRFFIREDDGMPCVEYL